MEDEIAPKALARMLELVMRTGFVREGVEERHLTDWPALRYFSKTATVARTRLGLGNYLGCSSIMAATIIDRLLYSRLLIDEGEGCVSMTAAGCAMLELDPSQNLVIVVATLPPAARQDLASGLEMLLESLVDPDKILRH